MFILGNTKNFEKCFKQKLSHQNTFFMFYAFLSYDW